MTDSFKVCLYILLKLKIKLFVLYDALDCMGIPDINFLIAISALEETKTQSHSTNNWKIQDIRSPL